MSFIVSINPSYKCNFSCHWCYLTKEQLRDKRRSTIADISKRLKEISKHKAITHIDLYGGEIGILPIKYLLELDQVLRAYTQSINIITNLRLINPYFLRDDITISVSYDFNYRQDSEIVFENISKLNKNVSILTLGIPEILNTDPKIFINKLATLNNVSSWEIKRYSTNQSNNILSPHSKYENFILKCLKIENKMPFLFINRVLLENSLFKKYSMLSDNHIYITPNGFFGVLDFDSKDREFFLELESFEAYLKWCESEKFKVRSNAFCSSCEYFYNGCPTCYTEHARGPKKCQKKYSCDGLYLLLKKFALYNNTKNF